MKWFRIGLSTSIIVGILVVYFFIDKSAVASINVSQTHQAPSLDHLFGTDQLGRDVFSRTIVAAVNAIKFALLAYIVAISFGIMLGLISALTKLKALSETIGFLIQLCFVTPFLLVLVSVSSLFGYSNETALIIVCVLIWAWPARLTKSLAENIVRQNQNKVAVTMGMSSGWRTRFIFLPSIVPVILFSSKPIMVEIFAIDIVVSLFGFGADTGEASFGNILKDGIDFIFVAPWMFYLPVMVLCFTCLFCSDFFANINKSS